MRAQPVVSIAFMLFVVLIGVAAAEDGDIARTPSGKPDLSGTYDIANLTPWERDAKYGNQRIMPPEDAEAIARNIAGFTDALSRDSDPNREAPPAGGDGSAGPSGKVGGYNFFWIDMGTQIYPIDGEYRTSVLYDPPNGRLPPLSVAGKKRRAEHHPYSYVNTGDAWWLETGDDPYDGPESLSASDRCLYVGVATVPARSVPLQQPQAHRADRHTRVDPGGVDALGACHPPRLRASARRRALAQRRLDRLVGGRHSGRRHDQLHRPAGPAERQAARGRALHADGLRRAALPVHRR